ncbi:hypothetical protein B0E53_04434 [Micromonospora sp. MH33]|nr:hypothetical protein B0E53_04434 [Micromonospora sp. MH33]
MASRPISSADRACVRPASAAVTEQTVHAPPASRAGAGSESGASAMPSGRPRGTPSMERRETSTVFGRSAPMTSSAEA